MKLSIIIVNYNNKELIKELLHSIYNALLPFDSEVIVSDNSSSDGSTQMISNEFPQVAVINNISNLGFAKANNIAAKRAKGELLLFLNPDTVVNKNAIVRCVNFLAEHKTVGGCGVRVMKPDGKLDAACRRSFPTPSVALYRMLFISKIFKKSKLFAKYNLTHLPQEGVYEVDSLVGAFMMIKKDIFQQVGGFDEDYFMYGEDIDLCFKIKSAGHKIFYLGDAAIVHKKGGSTKKDSKIIKEFYKSMIIFYKKNYSKNNNILLNCLVYLGIYSRCLLELIFNLITRM